MNLVDRELAAKAKYMVNDTTAVVFVIDGAGTPTHLSTNPRMVDIPENCRLFEHLSDAQAHREKILADQAAAKSGVALDSQAAPAAAQTVSEPAKPRRGRPSKAVAAAA